MNREYHSSAQPAITQRHLPIKPQGFIVQVLQMVETVGASRRQGRLWRRFCGLRSLTAVFRVSFFPSYTRIRTHSFFCILGRGFLSAFFHQKNGPCGPFLLVDEGGVEFSAKTAVSIENTAFRLSYAFYMRPFPRLLTL